MAVKGDAIELAGILEQHKIGNASRMIPNRKRIAWKVTLHVGGSHSCSGVHCHALVHMADVSQECRVHEDVAGALIVKKKQVGGIVPLSSK